jgi:hypothetical protein
MSQLDAVITKWLKLAKEYRDCANERWDSGDDEEATLYLNEADRLESCANEVRAALKAPDTADVGGSRDGV